MVIDNPMTEEEMRQIDARWKSDFERKLDRVLTFVQKFEQDYESLMKTLVMREQKRSKIRNAIIEKSLAGLIWAALVFVGISAWEYVRAHIGAK